MRQMILLTLGAIGAAGTVWYAAMNQAWTAGLLGMGSMLLCWLSDRAAMEDKDK